MSPTRYEIICPGCGHRILGKGIRDLAAKFQTHARSYH